MSALVLSLLSPEATYPEQEVTSVAFPGVDGSFEVLKDHAPLIAALKEGDVVYVTADGQEQKLSIKSGVVEVYKNKVSVCFE